jgi:paraquat-inducible protein A
MLALALGSAVLFVVSNLFPIASLDAQGLHTATTLTGTVTALYQQGRPLVAALVLVTTILVPALELGAMLYMLVPLRFGLVSDGMRAAFRFVLAAHPWNMMEVFMLGVLVTLVKLAELASIVPGVALWAFAGLIVLFSMLTASFSVRDYWGWVDSIRATAADGAMNSVER